MQVFVTDGPERKIFKAAIAASLDARELMRNVRDNLDEVMPLDFKAEPIATDHVQSNATLTGAIPGRGHFQMRVAEVTETEITLLTVEGIPSQQLLRFATTTWRRSWPSGAPRASTAL
ncbi:MAG TPA: hypothetical protein VM680_04840 [Verrucomicrobiae bacterium]|nr:hypothetical protein [Verrucomicrobiae bacterium]